MGKATANLAPEEIRNPWLPIVCIMYKDVPLPPTISAVASPKAPKDKAQPVTRLVMEERAGLAGRVPSEKKELKELVTLGMNQIKTGFVLLLK